MAMGYYELKLSSNNQYHFALKAANHEIILSSEMYTTKAAANNGIESVRANCVEDDQYERKKSSNNKDYFVLLAKNFQVIGTSETYNSSASMEKGIASVKQNGQSPTVKELTPA